HLRTRLDFRAGRQSRLSDMSFPRASGILLHPTSLPGRFGIGDLGDGAYVFADFLVASGQSIWQVLPLGPTGYGDSPYACYSAFAGNTLLISPDRLVSDGLLNNEELALAPESAAGRVDFAAVHKFKELILGNAFAAFKRESDPDLRAAFQEFCRRSADWLEDYALFRALKDAHGGIAWNEWGPSLARKEPDATRVAQGELSQQVEAQ